MSTYDIGLDVLGAAPSRGRNAVAQTRPLPPPPSVAPARPPAAMSNVLPPSVTTALSTMNASQKAAAAGHVLKKLGVPDHQVPSLLKTLAQKLAPIANVKAAAAAANAAQAKAAANPTAANKSAAASATAKSNAASAAAHANATAKKLSKKYASVAKALTSAASALTSKATTIKGDTANYGPNTGPKSGADVMALHAIVVQTDILNAQAIAGDVLAEVSPLVDQLQTSGNTALVTSGQSIINQATTIANDSVTDHKDDSQALQSTAAAWVTSAQSALGLATTPLAGTPGAPWQPNFPYKGGVTCTNNGNLYTAVGAQGVSGPSGGPTGTGTTAAGTGIVDGTVTWSYSGPAPVSTTAGAPGAQWAPSTFYSAGQQVSNYGNLYTCSTGGISASSGAGPTATSGTIVDGACRWTYAGVATQAGNPTPPSGYPWQPSTNYPVGIQATNNGSLYSAMTTGVSGQSGGPMSTYGTSTDGTVQWSYAGPDPNLQNQYQQGGYGGGGDDGGGGGGGIDSNNALDDSTDDGSGDSGGQGGMLDTSDDSDVDPGTGSAATGGSDPDAFDQDPSVVAVQQFRQGGVDPFADDDGSDGAPADQGGLDAGDGSYSSVDDGSDDGGDVDNSLQDSGDQMAAAKALLDAQDDVSGDEIFGNWFDDWKKLLRSGAKKVREIDADIPKGVRMVDADIDKGVHMADADIDKGIHMLNADLAGKKQAARQANLTQATQQIATRRAAMAAAKAMLDDDVNGDEIFGVPSQNQFLNALFRTSAGTGYQAQINNPNAYRGQASAGVLQQQQSAQAQLAAVQQAITQQRMAAIQASQAQSLATSSAPATPGSSNGLPSTASSAPPDPNNPGYLTDGTVDPNYVAQAASSVVGAILHDMVDDIIIQDYNTEITDEEGDPQRRTASVHRGASYITDRQYPLRGGAANGQDGGSVPMQPDQTISVFGSSYLRGCDVLGAAKKVVPPRAGFVQRVSPGGNRMTALVVNKPKQGNHAASIANARTAATRSISIGNKVKTIATKLAAAVKTKVKGAPSIAAVTPTHRAAAARHIVTAAQLSALAQKAIAAGTALKKSADKHEALIAAKGKAEKAHSIAARAKTMLGLSTYNAERAADILGAHMDSLAANAAVDNMFRTVEDDVFFGLGSTVVSVTPNLPTVMPSTMPPTYPNQYPAPYGAPNQYGTPYGAPNQYPNPYGTQQSLYVPAPAAYSTSPPNPATPGYLMDGTPDPAYGAAAGTGAPPDPNNPGYLTDGTPDPAYGGAGNDPTFGLGPPPTVAPPLVPGVDYDPDPWFGVGSAGTPDTNAYSSIPANSPRSQTPLPNGFVLYDGSHDFGNMDLGSLNYYVDIPGGGAPHKNGFVLNQGGWTGGAVHHGGGWMAVRGSNQDTITSKEAPLSGPTNRGPQLQDTSIKYGWGPLIGNPNGGKGGWTKGLRFDAGGNQWFWFRDQAPAWATAPDDQARLNQAQLDYKAALTTAQANAAAQTAQDQLDAANATALAKQQALEDAATARQQQQEQNQAQSDAAVQATQDQASANAQQLADEAMARQQGAQSDIDTKQWQAQAVTQAQIQQQQDAAQLQLDIQAAQAAQALDANEPGGAGDGSDQGTDDGSQDQGTSSDAMDDGGDGSNGSSLDSAKAQLEDDDGTSMEGLSGSAKLKSRIDGRRF